jgi:hypothetical protein
MHITFGTILALVAAACMPILYVQVYNRWPKGWDLAIVLAIPLTLALLWSL